MIKFRRSDDRGHTKLNWLDSRHTFSFGDYQDPKYMGFRDLRVINEDRVSPARGFGTHSHRDMEIITYVMEGAVEHKDSTGTQTTIVPGEVQRMSAGTGISHSELNPSKTEAVHFLQIWILPGRQNLAPSYEQRSFDPGKNRDRWTLVAAGNGRDGAVTVHQDVSLSAAHLLAGRQIAYRLKPDRHAWLQVARGAATLNGTVLKAGDGAAVSQDKILEVRALEATEVLLFDLA
jgi:redox-sensitive bicupin YhaK (pirin superfamily)